MSPSTARLLLCFNRAAYSFLFASIAVPIDLLVHLLLSLCYLNFNFSGVLKRSKSSWRMMKSANKCSHHQEFELPILYCWLLMKVLCSTVKTCYDGIKLRSPKFEDKAFSSGNDSPCNVKCISDECVEHGDLMVDFGINHIFNQMAIDNGELEGIDQTLKKSCWDLGSLASYKNINLDEYEIIKILKDLFVKGKSAAPALYFFIWSYHSMGSKLTIQSLCTMMPVLIAGDMNYRAMDLTLYLVRKNIGEDWWLSLLFRVYFETCLSRQVFLNRLTK